MKLSILVRSVEGKHTVLTKTLAPCHSERREICWPMPKSIVCGRVRGWQTL